MLSSPQVVTVNAVDSDLNLVLNEGLASTYRSNDATLEFKVSHQESKTRTRRMVRLDQTKIASDPLTAINAYQRAGVYLVMDEPDYGFSTAEMGYLVEALKTWLTTANIEAMLASRH